RQQELLLIDNASGDGSPEMLRRHYNEYRLILNQQNLGYCGGANLGIHETRGEYILLLNPDIILEPDFIAQLVGYAETHSKYGIFSGKLLRFDKRTIDSTGQFLRANITPRERGYGEKDSGQYEQAGPVFSACGAVAFYRRTMLEDIRLGNEYFDESYFAFLEDLDIGWRAQLFDWQAAYVPKAIAYHYRGGGLSRQPRKAAWFERLPFLPKVSFSRKPLFIQRHVLVNRYLIILKNASWRDLLAGLPGILKCEILVWGYVLLVRPILFLAIGDFLKHLPKILRKRKQIVHRRRLSPSKFRRRLRDISAQIHSG
ncbi:MAG: glycosyltransferase, partial [bacterium]|nr:glycosyltransferase [bacterium]